MNAKKIEIPKFDATDHITGTEAEFKDQINKTKGKFLKTPGEYNLRVVDIKLHGVMANDKNWVGYIFELENTLGERMNRFQMFPIRRVDNFKYGPKATFFPYKGLLEFLGAFGIELPFETAMGTLGGLLGNMEVFIDKKFTANVGYEGSWTRDLGKNEETGTYESEIIHKGEPLPDEDGNRMVFADYKAANNYAAAIKLTLQGFPEILSFLPGKESIVKSVAAEEIDSSDIPF